MIIIKNQILVKIFCQRKTLLFKKNKKKLERQFTDVVNTI